VFIYHQHNVCALSALLCHFTFHWIGQLALALFHGNINLTSIDFVTQSTLQFIKLYPVYGIFLKYNTVNNNNDDDNNINIKIIIKD